MKLIFRSILNKLLFLLLVSFSNAFADEEIDNAVFKLITKYATSHEVCKSSKNSLTKEQLYLRSLREKYLSKESIESDVFVHNSLDLAILANDIDVVEKLLKRNVELSDGVVIWLVRYASIDVLKIALENGLDPNISPVGMQSGLIEAVTTGLINETKLLLKYRADINYRLENGRYPLDYSIGCGHKQLSQLLIDQGARMSRSNVQKAKDLGLVLR